MARSKTVLSEELQAAITEAARAGAIEAVNVGAGASVNYYKAMESLLYNYKKLAILVADEEAYCEVEYHGGKKSFAASAHSTGYYQQSSEAEIVEEMQEEKRKQFQQTRFGFDRLERAINLHADRKEFIIVRMYYFGEDLYGNEQESGQRYTWEQVAEACEAAGLLKEIKTARRWRNRIVNDMAVCVFGIPAAISAGTFRASHNDQNMTIT